MRAEHHHFSIEIHHFQSKFIVFQQRTAPVGKVSCLNAEPAGSAAISAAERAASKIDPNQPQNGRKIKIYRTCEAVVELCEGGFLARSSCD